MLGFEFSNWRLTFKLEFDFSLPIAQPRDLGHDATIPLCHDTSMYPSHSGSVDLLDPSRTFLQFSCHTNPYAEHILNIPLLSPLQAKKSSVIRDESFILKMA